MSDATLYPLDVVESVNVALRGLNSRKVEALSSIRDARKKLLLLACVIARHGRRSLGLQVNLPHRPRLPHPPVFLRWETSAARAGLAAEETLHNDLQLLQAVGVVREFLEGGNLPARGRADMMRAETQLGLARKSAARALSTLAKAAERVEAEIAAREAATAALVAEQKEASVSLSVQEALLAARLAKPTKRDGAAPPPSKDDALLLRERLKASAQMQQAEIRRLEAELERLTKRTFVDFGAAHGGM